MLARIVHQLMYISPKAQTSRRNKKWVLTEGVQAPGVSRTNLIDKQPCWGYPSRFNHHQPFTTRLEEENQVHTVVICEIMSRPKHYFLAAIGNPPEGPIRLGNIISLPRLADDPINEESVPLSAVPGMKVVEHNEPNYTLDIDKSATSHAGVWASFLQTIVGVGGDVSAEAGRETGEQWRCTNLQTLSFTPKLDYIVRCLEDEGVRHYMRLNKPWLPGASSRLFMITGVKIAYGAASTVRCARQKGLSLSFGVDLTALGVPLQFGPEAGRKTNVSVTQSQEGAEPFVFAFRLRRIKVSKAGVEHRQYDKGAMLGIREAEESGLDEAADVFVEGVDDDDVNGSQFGLSDQDVADDGTSDKATCTVAAVEE